MKAVRFHEHGGPEVLRVEEIPEPEPGAGEVRVAVRAVALNRLDVLVRRGLPIRMEMPHIGGVDFAGVVDAVGPGVASPRVGERVVGYPLLGYGDGPLPAPGERPDGPARILGEQVNGACCEALVLPAENVVPLPDGVEDVEAAALPVVFITAWEMLVERAALAPGETLLVQGAGSGVGTAAIQIGKLHGARVIACTRGEEKARRARELGADEALVGDAATASRVRRLTGRRGADVVFEHVGAATWQESVSSAAYRGRIVCCGATTGRSAPLDLTYLFAKELSIFGVTLGRRENLVRVLEHVAKGELRGVVDRVLPLESCREGHELLEAGAPFGKIVLTT